MQGEHERARELNEESLRLFRKLEDKRGIENTLGALGLTALRNGEYERARELYEEGLRLSRELGNKRLIAELLAHLGWVAGTQGEHERAGELYEEGLRLFRELGAKDSIAYSLVGLAVVARVQQEHERATQLLGAADAFWKNYGGSPELGTRKQMEETSREARTGLGAKAYEAARKEGRAITLEQAIAYALGES